MELVNILGIIRDNEGDRHNILILGVAVLKNDRP